MQNSKPIKWMLLFSAYLPLFIVIGIEHITLSLPKTAGKKHVFRKELHAVFVEPKYLLSFLALLMIIVSVVSCVVILTYVHDTVKTRTAPERVLVTSIKMREQDVLAYLVTYILPLFTLGSQTWRDTIALIFTLLVIFWLSLRTDMLFVNPLFLMMGYHMYAVETNTGQMLLLSKLNQAQIRIGDSRICYRLEKGFVLVDGDS